MNRFIMPAAALLVTAAFVIAATRVAPVKDPKIETKLEPYSKDWMKERSDQARSIIKAGQCYVDVVTFEPKFSFEKKYTYVGNIIYVIEVDEGKGALVAQPNPECKLFVEESYKCEYWFRSMPFDEPFLISPSTRETECPPEFTRENMIKRLKASREASEFNLGDL